VVLDVCINKLQQRFHSFNQIVDRFAFLFPQNLTSYSDDDLCKATSEFASIYQGDVSTDITGQLLTLRICLRDQMLQSPREVLKFILQNRLQSCIPDAVTAYMLFLTLPVTVASCERSFSKLRLIKSYLRSSCGQNRLSNLAIISIESQATRKLNTQQLIHDFASAKARKQVFESE
jgi:hypothetical protein